MSRAHIWLRAETKPLEERVALTPNTAAQLLKAGYKVTVEDSPQRAISSHAFAETGCDIVPAHSWRHSDKSTIILGLKELDNESWPLEHRHIHFAHIYKYQHGWQQVLQRFIEGNGQLFDLEYLIDDNHRRIAAFGYWAGFAGAAVALKALAGNRQQKSPVLPPLHSYQDKQQLINDIRSELDSSAELKALVIGARGGSGHGAVEMLQSAGVKVIEWDMEETARGGPFPELLEVDAVINCVFIQKKIPPFITTDLIQRANRRLSVICDVSCDPYGDYNPLPIYDQCTSFVEPTMRLIDSDNPLDLIAIDHLPSLLPVESSEDFCQQLLPYLLELDNLEQGVWKKAHQIFEAKVREFKKA
ncbi:saccharopine dehydrogenase [Endozoicomonas arenosclerae]|uniref:saccharopine dehydrogenase n=1 Tax=Endozoicomonas arenosclerae TaxID=1633495 RepID=UPI0007847792|nr:saccharopine dehydrogenase [Endozoicomonas arenosclerae]